MTEDETAPSSSPGTTDEEEDVFENHYGNDDDDDGGGEPNANGEEKGVQKSSAPRSRRSCMKVATLQESLDSVTDDEPPRKTKAEMILSFLGRLDGDERRTSRGSLLNSMHKQRVFRMTSSGLLEGDDRDDEVPAKRGESKGTRFFDVEVREYEVAASDNPCVRNGVALELGWNYNVSERVHLDTFEERRSEERSKNFAHEKKLSRLERERLLREFGASQKDMQAAAKRATIIRNKRKKSIANQHQDELHERMEDRLDRLKGLFSFSGRGFRKGAEPVDGSGSIRRASTLLAIMDAMDANSDPAGSQRSVASTSSILKNSSANIDVGKGGE